VTAKVMTGAVTLFPEYAFRHRLRAHYELEASLKLNDGEFCDQFLVAHVSYLLSLVISEQPQLLEHG
jgi:hypothetical protein